MKETWIYEARFQVIYYSFFTSKTLRSSLTIYSNNSMSKSAIDISKIRYQKSPLKISRNEI